MRDSDRHSGPEPQAMLAAAPQLQVYVRRVAQALNCVCIKRSMEACLIL